MNLQTLLNTQAESARGGSPRPDHGLSPSNRSISGLPQMDHGKAFLPSVGAMQANPSSSGLASFNNQAPVAPGIQYKGYGVGSSAMPEASQGSDWKTSQRGNGPPLPRKKHSASSSPKIEPQAPFPANGHEVKPMTPPQQAPLKALLTGVSASLRTIERFKNNEFKIDVPLKDGGAPLGHHFPDQPTLVTAEAYANQSAWATLWRPEALDAVFPDVAVTEQTATMALERPMRSLAELRAHVEQSYAPEDVWIAENVHIMHPLTCVTSKAHSNCLGCSTFFNSMASIREDLRPRGNYDMLRHESEHTETFTGLITMNGSFLRQQVGPMACDTLNTLFHSDDPNGFVLWGFVAPWEAAKLSDEDQVLLRQESFVDPEYLERRVKVAYSLQKVGQTIVVPAHWTFFAVRMGRGLAFSAQWNFLPPNQLANARRAVEANRAARLFRPYNFAALVQTAAFSVLDDLDTADTAVDRRYSCELLLKLLPLLKTQVLEDLLGEKLSLSAHAVLTYDSVIDQFSKKTPKSQLSTQLQQELAQIKVLPPPNLDADIKDDDDEDARFQCAHCKTVLWNLRRSCNSCKFDMCEPCFLLYGKHHQHKLRKYRKMTLQNLFDLVENVRSVLTDHEMDIVPPPAKKPKQHKDQRDKERLDRAERAERERETRPRRSVQPPVEDEYRVEDEEEPMEELPTYDQPVAPPRGQQQQQPANEDEETIDCICGNNKDLGFMISCELCRCWLHGRCVGINKKNEPDEYYCPRCVKKNNLPQQQFGLPQPLLTNTGILQPKNFSPDEKLRQYNLI